jgi:aldose 1-epimerase
LVHAIADERAYPARGSRENPNGRLLELRGLAPGRRKRDDAPVISKGTMDGLRALTIGSAADGGLEATFVPGAGMVGASLRHRGAELLGQRGGLGPYVAERKTMGIPLLHPWANRIARRRFAVAGRDVVIDPEATPLRLDGAGLPMHGLLSAASGWEVRAHEPTADGARLVAAFDFAARKDLMAAFPFEHELLLEAEVAGPALTIATTVRATGAVAVPIAFGFHPYLRLPGVPREDWEVEIPVREQLLLDAAMLPTGERAAVEIAPGPLGARTFDDAYAAPPGGAPFALAGGGRRIELAFLSGFPYAQVFAPAEDDVVAFEPMAAPTNALVDAGPELPLLPRGDSYRAAFAIAVTDAA